MPNNIYKRTTLTGGGKDAVDGIEAIGLKDGDRAFIEETQEWYVLKDGEFSPDPGYVLTPGGPGCH
ncbi:MAG: hypothetical protein WC750_06365 [Patescibacteria group bacterium]|jgi:hypothetical protein